MDFSKLSTNHWIAGGGAVAALVGLVLPWYSSGSGEFSASENGFGVGIVTWLNGLLIVAAGVLAALYAMGVFELSFWKFSGYDLPLIVGIASTFQLILFFLRQTSNTAIGFYLTILGGIAVVVGMILHLQSDDAPAVAAGGQPTTF